MLSLFLTFSEEMQAYHKIKQLTFSSQRRMLLCSFMRISYKEKRSLIAYYCHNKKFWLKILEI